MLCSAIKFIIAIMSDMWSESKRKMTRALVRAGLIDDPRERVLTNLEVQFPTGGGDHRLPGDKRQVDGGDVRVL